MTPVPEAGIERTGSSGFRVHGVISFATANRLRREGAVFFESNASLEVDLSLVTAADSAAVSLLLEWMRVARAKGGKLKIIGVPEQILAIARTSRLHEVLPVA